jgi:hypothetical protein
MAIRPQAIPPAQRDEHLPRPWIGQAESDFDRLLALSSSCSRALMRSAAAPAAAFSPAVAAPANRASILRSLSRRAASSFILVTVGATAVEPLLWITKGEKSMAHAILRGANGRRHDVAFEDAGTTLGIVFGDETVEIVLASPHHLAPSDKRRFALLNVPRELFNKGLGEAARRSKTERPGVLVEGR